MGEQPGPGRRLFERPILQRVRELSEGRMECPDWMLVNLAGSTFLCAQFLRGGMALPRPEDGQIYLDAIPDRGAVVVFLLPQLFGFG